MNREAETAPSCSYMERHASSGLTPEMRTVAVSWLVEVEGAFELQQETLFLAVSYLDRFLSVAQVSLNLFGPSSGRPSPFTYTACPLRHRRAFPRQCCSLSPWRASAWRANRKRCGRGCTWEACIMPAIMS